MSLLEKLQPASFRNVAFLVNVETVKRGKKFVVHEYPNSDSRYVEELGKLPPIFTLEAIIHGSDALNQRFRLENALEKKGQGKLVHPVYGELDVTSLEFSVTSKQTTLGEIRLSIRFAISRINITPTPTVTNTSTVTQEAEKTRTAVDSALVATYTTPLTTENFDAISNTSISLWETIQKTVNANVDLASEGAARFNRVVRTAINNVFSIVQTGEQLRDAIKLVIDTALDAARVPEQLAASWNSLINSTLFPVGSTDPIPGGSAIPPETSDVITISDPKVIALLPITTTLTPEQLQREQNKASIIEHLRLTALANSYEAQVYTDFSTDLELEAAKEYSDNQYIEQLFKLPAIIKAGSTAILIGGAPITVPGTTPLTGMQALADKQEVKNNFSVLRNTARKVFATKEKATFRVNTITPGKTSMALTAYRYYGDLDKLELLTALNPGKNTANFDGEVKALAE